MELNKRYNFNRRLTKEEVDHNWEEIEAGFQSVGQLFPDGIINGGFISWSETGYVYHVSPVTVKFPNESNPVTFPFTIITFDNGDAEDRFDLPYVDFEGVKIKKGDPSVNPLIPQLEDGQYALTPILIKAATSAPEPGDVATTKVFAENEVPPEFSGSFTGVGTVNFESPTARTGAKAIEFTNVVSGGRVIMNAGVDFDLNEVDLTSFWLRLKSNFTGQQNLQVYFRDANGVQLTSATNISFTKNQVGVYQFVAIAISSLTFLSANTMARTITLRFTTNNMTPKDGFFVDDWNIQGGIAQPEPVTEHDSLPGIKGNGTFHLSETERDWLYPTIFEGVAIPLSNPIRGAHKEAVSTAAVYNIVESPAPVTGGWAKYKINVSQATLDAATLDEPEITDCTKIAGSEFVADTDMYIIVEKTISGAVEYWFAQIAEI